MARDRRRRTFDPADAEAKLRLAQDGAVTFCGVFLIVFGSIFVRDPTILTAMFGAGLGCFGLPATRRIDRRLKIDREQSGEGDDAERWSHLP